MRIQTMDLITPFFVKVHHPSAQIACNLAHLTVSMEAPVLAAANTLDSGCLVNLWRPGQFYDLEHEHKAWQARFPTEKQPCIRVAQKRRLREGLGRRHRRCKCNISKLSNNTGQHSLQAISSQPHFNR
jgi:hypothetical protein